MLSIMNNPQIYSISFRDRANGARCSVTRKSDRGIEWVLDSVQEEVKKMGIEASGFCVSNLTQTN
jgi:hypothetical protein